MTKLSVGIVGLRRLGASVGLALKRYTRNEGKYQFEITGYDVESDVAKRAAKMGAVDRVVYNVADAAQDRSIILLAAGYEEVRGLLKRMAPEMREGTVVLDASPLKRPSLDWASEFFSEDQHLVGITPIVNPKYIFSAMEDVEMAREDLFDESSILISPAAKALQEAVDLAFNFCAILGSKPRFMDPEEHDVLLTRTVGVPQMLGLALFHTLLHQSTWSDVQWFTNPGWGVLTLPLRDVHPDGLRDTWMNQPEVTARALDEVIETLTALRDRVQAEDRKGVEEVIVTASEAYQKWLTHRYKADWDRLDEPKVDAGQSLMGSIFGTAVSRRLMGNRRDND